jgi:ribose 5-phosphate isomerase A
VQKLHVIERPDREKRAVGDAAAALVEDGMTVGLGTGSTAAHFVSALALRDLDVRCVATSPETEKAARRLGLDVSPLENIGDLDIAIDGADQIDPFGWLVKGGGGAHTREKIVAAAAERFVVIVSADKLVGALRPPVPLELLAFGVSATLRAFESTSLRGVDPSPDGGLIADYFGPVNDPPGLAELFAGTPGVVDHGLFSPELVSDVLVAHGDEVQRREFA